MDYQVLADLLFPNVTDTPESLEERFPLREVPEGAVITRMAPSPTGFVHLGNLVQGLTSERMAHQSGGVLFLRVEDTDAKREVLGAAEALIKTLSTYGIEFDEGAIERIAEVAVDLNMTSEDIGARRLHTVMEYLLEDISFNAGGDYPLFTLKIDKKYVDEHLQKLTGNRNLKKYVL